MMRHPMRVFLAVLFVLFFSGPVRADGFILPIRPEIAHNQSYRVDYHEVHIEVTDSVADVRVDQSFTNLLDRPLEVSYLFPVPSGAVVSGFSLVVDGQEMPAGLYDREEARRLYEEIVRQRRDPALLEYIGRGLFRTSVFPLPPRGTRLVKLHYQQVVENTGGLCRLVYPLATEKYSARPLERVAVTVSIASRQPINNFYSPHHAFTFLSRTDHEIVARYSERGVTPRSDVTVFYQLASADDFDATVLTYRPDPAADGYFLLLASPRAELPRGAVQPKTILFVLDRSGSMAGEKLLQAKQALHTILPNLGAKDRFNLIVYNDRVESFRPVSVAATRDQIDAALRFADGITAIGATDLDAALREALPQIPAEDNQGRYVVFLTDGQPTAGETQPERIRARIRTANEKTRARLFVFGVGFDVNTVLLDGLAEDNRGLCTYVKPGEDLEAAVAGLYRRIENPVLTELSLTCDGVKLSDEYPRQLPDLFHGQQLVLCGRYQGSGRVRLVLSGQAGGERRRFVYQADFASGTDRLDRAFVARLWATRKIGYYLDQLRQLGVDSPGRQELMDEVIRLAKAYGIATEYTSFLVLEDSRTSSTELKRAAAAPASGAPAVGYADANKSLYAASSLQTEPEGANWTGGRVRSVGDKTFYLRDGVWVDAAFQDGAKTVGIKSYTDEYFALAKRLGNQVIYLSFAERIILVWDGQSYQIEP